MIRRPVRWRRRRLPSFFHFPVPFAFASGGAFLLFTLALAVPWAPRPTGPWKGYSVLLVREHSAAQARLQSLPPAGAQKAVSARTAMVAYCDFEGMAECAAADLGSRLDPADPRQDSWTRGLGGYFRLAGGPQEWEAAYLPAVSSPVLRFLRTAAALGFPWRDDWRFADFDPVAKLLSLLLAAAYAVLVCSAFGSGMRENAWLCAAPAVPWLLWVLGGGLVELLFFYLGWLAWMRLAREVEVLSRNIHRHAWKDQGRAELRLLLRILAAACGVAALFLLAAGFTAGRILEMLRLAAGLLAALCVPVLVHWRRKGERSVRFDPVTIVRRRPGRAFSLGIQGPSRSLLAVLVLLTPLAFTCASLLRSPGLPTPQRAAAARSFSWEALQAMASGAEEPGDLPDISQYLLHRAYQEGLPFGRAMVFPRRGERVQILEYLPLADSPKVVPRMRTVKVFDDGWVERTLASAGPASLERMLLRQGRPVTVSLRKALPFGSADLPYLAAVLLILLAALLWDGELGLLLFARLRIFTVGGRA